jgi:citrate/tricarballylate utilization protein
LVLAFGAAGLFAALALLIGLVRFWRGTGEQVSDLTNPPALATAIKDVLALKYLDDSGWGCAYPSEKSSQSRRWFHHFTFYGFLLCFAATTLGAIYYYGFGWKGPYGYFSLPVVLGALGGIGLLVGPIGLYFLKLRRNREITDEKQYGMDMAFVVMLLLTSASGLLLLGLRETTAMSSLLVIHLGVVMALFLTLPYGKFVHGVYRCAALVKYALERARKRTLGV